MRGKTHSDTTILGCPLCEGSVVARWRDVPVVECTQCGVLLRYPPPSSESLASLYGESWQDPDHHQAETGSTELEVAMQYGRRLAASLGCRDFRGMRILEFGAGRGTFQSVLLQLGADAVAIEPYGYDYLKSRGFRVFRSIDELPPNSRFDGIVSFQVIEHLSEPWIELRSLRARMMEGAWLYVSTVNAAGLNARLSGSHWREMTKRAHVIWFDERSLEQTLKRCGFSDARRLRWLMPHDKTGVRKLLLYALQALAVDGELRYLAWNR